MAEFLIIVVALFFAGMGVYGLALPARLVAPFGLTADSATARAEVRAVYGGFGVAVAGLLFFAAFDAHGIRSVAVVTVAVALLGMAFGRIVAALTDRPTRSTPCGSTSSSNSFWRDCCSARRPWARDAHTPAPVGALGAAGNICCAPP